MDAIYLPSLRLFKGFQRSTYCYSSRDRLYFSCRGFDVPYLLSSVLVVLLLVPVWLCLFDVFLQLPLPD